MTDPKTNEGPAPADVLKIWYNRNLKVSPGKLAAHAVHAALKTYGIEYDHRVVVLAASKNKVAEMPVSIRDAGHTELEPGTVTTGTEESRSPLPKGLHERIARRLFIERAIEFRDPLEFDSTDDASRTLRVMCEVHANAVLQEIQGSSDPTA